MKSKLTAVLLFGVAVAASILTGPTDLDWTDLGSEMFILLSGRIPRTIAVILAGAGLSLSGLVMQALTQNRFASPDTVGTMEWAKLGLLLAMLFMPELGGMNLILFTFLFATAGTLVFVLAVSRIRVKSALVIPLLGVMYGNVVGGFGDFLSFRNNLTQSLSTWSQGSFSLVIEGQYEPIYLTLVIIVGLYFFADYLTISRFGREGSLSLGLPFEAVLAIGTILVSLSVASILTTVGSLPFVGVVVPNLVSMRWGDNVRNTHQKTAFVGALFLLVCDTLARMLIAPYEVPVELILGLIGGGLFLWLLVRKGGRLA